MKRLRVCSVVLPWISEFTAGRTRYLLIDESRVNNPVTGCATLGALASAIKATAVITKNEPFRSIKNEPPGDILWMPDDTRSDTILECARLSRYEFIELVQLLKGS